MKKSEARSLLERIERCDIREDEALDALEPAGGWDPEEPELPKRLRLNQYGAHGSGEVFAAVVPDEYPDDGTLPMLAAVMRGWLRRDSRLPVLEAMVAAYNREREEERIEAQMDDAKLDEGLARICREEIEQEVSRGVQAERARCVHILEALRDQFIEGRGDLAMVEDLAAAIRKVHSGEPPNPYWKAPTAESTAAKTGGECECGLCARRVASVRAAIAGHWPKEWRRAKEGAPGRDSWHPALPGMALDGLIRATRAMEVYRKALEPLARLYAQIWGDGSSEADTRTGRLFLIIEPEHMAALRAACQLMGIFDGPDAPG